MKSDNKKTGNRGEELASEYLQKKGYRIEERNFRTRFGEIDIVCWDGQTLVFVEVKTKIGHDFGEPEEMVNKGKLERVRRMGEVFIRTQGIENSRTQGIENSRTQDGEIWKGGCRVDVVAIVLKETGEVEKLEHYEAVY
jgi:putative endonuclease